MPNESRLTLAARKDERLCVGLISGTSVDAADGSIRNNVMLEHRSNGWVVVGYSLRPDAETDSATP